MKPRVPFWSSLRVRLMVGIIIPLVIILGVSSYFQFLRHRELMLDDLQQYSAIIGQSVMASLTRSMLDRNTSQISADIKELAARGSIRNVSILDTQGTIQFSSRPNDIGVHVPLTDPTCQACHQNGTNETSRSVIVTAADGSRAFRNVTPIRNEAACQTCHGPTALLNGVLIVDLPVEPIDSHLWADLQQNLLFTLATAILVIFVINLILSNAVISKLEWFRQSLAGFAHGNFEGRVPASGNDEIAELGRAINYMAVGLGEKAELERKVVATAEDLKRETERLTALYRVSLESSRSLELDQVMCAGLESALAVMNMDSGEIHLKGENRDSLVLRSSMGSPSEFLSAEENLKTGECICGGAVRQGEICAVGDITTNPRVTRLACRQHHYRSVAAIPLKARGSAIGVLSLHGRDMREFSREDLALLSAFGDQLGIAIDNARLYADMESRVQELSKQVQHLAVLEERDRLAREMHDGFAQSLSLLHLKLQMARADLNGNSKLADSLTEIRGIVDSAYDDVRQAIGDLRTPVGRNVDLVETLSEYIESFALRYDFQPIVKTTPDRVRAHCTPQVEIQVIRIIQEAMANVRKHSQAKSVEIEFELVQSGLLVQIRDDGRGFRQSDVPPGHFGLAIMRERAAGIGASLDIASVQGVGTTLSLCIPIIDEI